MVVRVEGTGIPVQEKITWRSAIALYDIPVKEDTTVPVPFRPGVHVTRWARVSDPTPMAY